jgi:hypothetical protein
MLRADVHVLKEWPTRFGCAPQQRREEELELPIVIRLERVSPRFPIDEHIVLFASLFAE